MLVIAENLNVMSKTLGPAMRERNPEPILAVTRELVANGADALDLNIGPSRKDGPDLMAWMVKTVQSVAGKLPLSLDTTNMDAIEAGLEVYDLSKSRPIINSIGADPVRISRLMPMVAKYNARFIGLCYGPDGIPRDADERAMLAAELMAGAMDHGVVLESMLLDPVVVPVSAQQNQVASVTEFLPMLPDMAPGAESTCGLSNVSNGSPNALRPILNRVYLMMLRASGLTSAILDGLDKEILAIAHDERPEQDALVARAMAGEADWREAGSDLERDIIKTVNVLMNRSLYSDSWLEL